MSEHSRVVYRFFTPPQAGIGKLPALAGRYFGISFRYYIGKFYWHWLVGIFWYIILVLLCMSFFAYLS